MIRLPYPPSANSYWRHVGNRVILSKEAREYRREVRKWLGGDMAMLESRLSVTIDVYPPDRRRRDLDNILKQLFDALTHAKVWEDDSQVDQMIVTRREILKGGLVCVGIVGLG